MAAIIDQKIQLGFDLFKATDIGKGQISKEGIMKVRKDLIFLGKPSYGVAGPLAIDWPRKNILFDSPNQKTAKVNINIIQCQDMIPKIKISKPIRRLYGCRFNDFQLIIKAYIRILQESRKRETKGIFLKLT